MTTDRRERRGKNMNRKNIKKTIIMLLVACMCIGSVPVTAGAAAKTTTQTAASRKKAKKVKLGTPKPTRFRFYKIAEHAVTGCYYRSTWKKVRGASGYQVQIKTYSGGSPYKRTFLTRRCWASFSSSDVYKAKIRVRAYKKLGKKVIYGSYSKWVTSGDLLWSWLVT